MARKSIVFADAVHALVLVPTFVDALPALLLPMYVVHERMVKAREP